MVYKNYILAIVVLAVVGYFGDSLKKYLNGDPKDEYDMVKQYLLNDSPLYGYNRPKLWIHSKYEYNSRKWKSFYSRSSYDLNQPYIHLTIKSIINHCGDDFNVCLIDDETFSKLIPGWDADLSKMCEPIKGHMREIGMAQLLYYYGGMVVPNSFVCCKNLIDLYQDGLGDKSDQFFVTERVNKHEELVHTQRRRYMPDVYLMGANKRNKMVKEYVEFLKTLYGCPDYRLSVALPPMSGPPLEKGFSSYSSVFSMGENVVDAKVNLLDAGVGVGGNSGNVRSGNSVSSHVIRRGEEASGLPDLDGPRGVERVQAIYTWESEFTGDVANWLLERVLRQEIGLVGGEFIGVKARDGSPIDLDELLADGFLDVDNGRLYGLFIPAEDLLIRPKYAWFAVLPAYQVLNTHTIVAKYLKLSIIDSADIYQQSVKKNKQKSVVAL